MVRSIKTWMILWFSVATLISAFLVFQVQPVISKTVLPWYGGSPAVWTTCLLFFQVLLFGGYAYAHLITRWLPSRWQSLGHFGLILGALLVLPITPGGDWKPSGSQVPTTQLLWLLAANVGLPYFLLASTGPLLQAWFSERLPGRSPYRLYALSNAGSLAALISYPFVVEPAFSTTTQGSLWSLGFCGFALACGYLTASHFGLPADRSVAGGTARAGWTFNFRCRWLLLPALASVALLATTNHVSQDIAVIPFLWIAPLSLYLLTFIICFDREQWYSRRWYGVLAVISGLLLSLALDRSWDYDLVLEIAIYLNLMFWVCMVCHGELVRSKPSPQHLTAFYLMTSAGGALGGIFVAVICPIIFQQHWEMSLVVVAGTCVGLWLFLSDAHATWLGAHWKRRVIAGLGWVAVLAFLLPIQLIDRSHDTLETVRNFYGVLHVQRDDNDRGTLMIHGRTMHGFQFDHPGLRRVPTTYYAPESGVGLVLRHLRPEQPRRIGAVGLGCGTIASYGSESDYFRFYEINPAVVELAQKHFSFLDDSPADIDVVLGDARLSLEEEEDQDFDVLVLDAFSSDAIPTHLLTREAFAIYDRHLDSHGIIAIHISNRSLRLCPVVVRLATQFNFDSLQVVTPPHFLRGSLGANWMLLTRNKELVHHPELAAAARHFPAGTPVNLPLWTDRYNNLFQIMKIF